MINETTPLENSNISENKSKKINNKHYRKFLDDGIIKVLNEDEIILALNNVGHFHRKEARSLIILLYLTGARPNEILRLRSKDIIKEKSYCVVKVPGSKKGLPRSIYLSSSNKLTKELLSFVLCLHPDRILFYHFKSNYLRRRKKKDGSISEKIEYTDKLRYHFKKWFSVIDPDSFTPYYLRHNRFSKLAMAGVNMTELRMLKGSRTFQSIEPYLHMSSDQAKKIAKKIK